MIMEKTYYYGTNNYHIDHPPMVLRRGRSIGTRMELDAGPPRLKAAARRIRKWELHDLKTMEEQWKKYHDLYLLPFEFMPDNFFSIKYYFKKCYGKHSRYAGRLILALAYLHSSYTIHEILANFRANPGAFRRLIAALQKSGIKSMRRPVLCSTLIQNFFVDKKIRITLEYKHKMLLYLRHTKRRAYKPQVRAAAICYALLRWNHLASQKTLAEYFEVSTVGLRIVWKRLEALK